MPAVTRARARATDKPPSPLKNILKGPARRNGKKDPVPSTRSSAVTDVKKVGRDRNEVGVVAGQATHGRVRKVASVEHRSKGIRSDMTTTRNAESACKTSCTTKSNAVRIESRMQRSTNDIPTAPQSCPPHSPSDRMDVDAPTNVHKQRAMSMKKARLVPQEEHNQSGPSVLCRNPSVDKISARRSAQTALHKKSSSEGLLCRSPVKASLASLQKVLSSSPKSSSKEAATGSFNCNDQSKPSSITPSLQCSPRKPSQLPNMFMKSPVRKAASPIKQTLRTPTRSDQSEKPTFGELFARIPSSPPTVSPEHPVFRTMATSPIRRQPLAEMGPPAIPMRSASKSTRKHTAEPLVPASPSKVPRLSPAKSNASLKLVTAHSSTSQATATPNKSSIRTAVVGDASAPMLSKKKSVTWNAAVDVSKSKNAARSTILAECVFFVDVNTSDGADAAHLFVPLLKELGAEVVPQWTSNSMGVTHVLFKDGDDRTLEKVVASNGLVKCVNVGWAIDCERLNEHLSEDAYAIDLSRVPGMTPTTTSKPDLSEWISNDILKSPCDFGDSSRGICVQALPCTPIAPTLDLKASTISITMPSLLAAGAQTANAAIKAYHIPFDASRSCGPLDHSRDFLIDADEDKENALPISQPGKCTASPSTPYFLHPQDLSQKSCPPKANLMLHDANTPLKQRLLLARRKSMEFAPRISSPLRLSSAEDTH